jgi:RNA polymerase sigma-70 factor (ECF subfamily)
MSTTFSIASPLISGADTTDSAGDAPDLVASCFAVIAGLRRGHSLNGTAGVGPATAARTTEVRTAPGEAAFVTFYRGTHTALAAYLQQSTRNSAVTDDLVQESYLRLLGAGRDVADASTRSYLFRIATNLLRDRFRRRDLEFPVEQDDGVLPDRSGSPPQEKAAIQRDVRQLLATLSTRDRELLWLAHVERMSHREVAAVVGLREASIRPMLFRARQRLAAALREAEVLPRTERKTP